MSTFEGVLRRLDLGGGAWLLVGVAGRWLLDGAVPNALEGKRVRVMGQVTPAFGIAMTGDPTVRVSTIQEATG